MDQLADLVLRSFDWLLLPSSAESSASVPCGRWTLCLGVCSGVPARPSLALKTMWACVRISNKCHSFSVIEEGRNIAASVNYGVLCWGLLHPQDTNTREPSLRNPKTP